MISHIFIKDFAIIENIDIDMYPGLNVITGETGAGKSIIIEAVSLALGSRADTAMVRTGKDKALIQLMLDESGLPSENRTDIELLGREISAAGKSVCRVNGEIVTLGQLAAATKRIADIHGQYDHQSLLDPDNHILIVDAYDADEIEPIKARVRADYESYIAAKKRLEELIADETASKRESDILRYEIRDIDATNPVPGEYEELTSRLKVMQNGEKIFEALAEAHKSLAGEDPSAIDGTGNAMNALRRICEFSDEYRDMADLMAEVYHNLTEVSGNIRRHMDLMDFSRQDLDDAISRIDLLDRLIDKYGGVPASSASTRKSDGIERVVEYRARAEEKLARFENIDEAKETLTDELSQAEKVLRTSSSELTALRARAAAALEKGIDEQLRALNFKNAAFCIKTETVSLGANGVDRMEFLLSANKGQPPLPIAKAVSGGEMSRIMLALKAVVGDYDNIPTMIFDEIDSGISGVTAGIVGEKLSKMALNRQIICITHLPQIAAFADHHFVIEKNSDDKTTYTTIGEVAGDGQVAEIARLLGGKNITPNILKSAAELIELSKR
jgi:DNA repair protein RecN (Recombination protein N)